SAPAQSTAHEGEASSVTPPLSRVSIFTSGVGEFFHETTVRDDEIVRLTIPRDQMSDVLRSLTVIDDDGGTPYQVDYAAGESLQERLRRFRVDLSGVTTLEDLLRQVRGAVVSGRTTAGEQFSGRVTAVSAEEEGVAGSDAGGASGSVVLAGEQSLRRLPIAEIADISVEDDEISDDISRGLDLLADVSGSSESRTLEIQLHGTGERRIGIRYLLEMPVWKTTYRAVLDDGEVVFQGWAHLDNTSPVDWEDTTVRLVSSAPDTAFFDVYPPRYVDRSRSRTVSSLYESAPTSMRSMAADSAAPSLPTERATTEERVSGVGFEISEPVQLARGQAAMIPIVNGRFSVELVRSFEPNRDDTHPRLAFGFTNEVDVRLPEGPLTIYDGDRYVGDAVLPVTPAGAARTIPYARDLELIVTREQDQAARELRTVRIVAGTLVAERREQLETRYTLERDGGAAARRAENGGRSSSDELPEIRISHPRRRGWDIVSPEPEETSPETAMINLSTSSVTVVEEHIIEQEYTLTEMNRDLLVEFSSNRLLPPRVRRILQNIIELRDQLNQFRSERQELEQRRDEIFRDQERIRGNMENLDRNSDLYRRYVSQLDSQENDLRFIRSDLEDAREEESEAEAALNAYLATLDS
ncbi:MAG: hypothetical protein ACOCYB_09120, partial [Alkalispirochaeta sp.]